jgi:hypothetical protein
MVRPIVTLGVLIPAAAFGAVQTGSTTAAAPVKSGGFLSRVFQPAAAGQQEQRQLAQFGPPRGTPAQYSIQQGQPQPQAQPQNSQPGMQPVLPGAPGQSATPASGTAGRRNSTSETPAPRKARRTPKPETDTDAESSDTAATPAAGKKNAPKDGGDLDQMVNKLEKGKAAKATQVENELTKSAEEATSAVGKLLKSSNDGKYSDALTCLTPELQKYFDSELSAVNGGIKTVLDRLTRNGDIRSVTYANATVRGEGAVVEADLTFGTGAPQKHMFDLLKTKTGWKIVLPVGDNSQASSAGAAVAAEPAPARAVVATPAPTPAPTPASPDPASSPTASNP